MPVLTPLLFASSELSENNAVPGLRRATHSNGFISQIGVEHHLYGGVKTIQITVKYYSFHD
jgi:hypothetical protein